MPPPLMKFKDLEYIVMEGGGARGAAYLGSIRALEQKMRELQVKDSTVKVYELSGGRTPGLLDYYREEAGGIKVPVIKGIAGASAGAITTFALGLGFNSTEIEEILKYPFERFLKDTDAGKYRMVTKDNKLGIGQDGKNKVSRGKEMTFDKEFVFDFRQDFTEIGDNQFKRVKRDLIFGAIVKALVDGVVSQVKQWTNLIGWLTKNENPEDAPKFWRGLFRWAAHKDNNLIPKIGLSRALRLFFFRVLMPKVFHAPMAFDTDNVMSMFADRGMFSGFKVREFFMDMVILAATKDTQFHRGLRELVQDKDITEIKKLFGNDITDRIRLINTKGISSLLLGYDQPDRIQGRDKFKIGERSKSKIGDEIRLELVLQCLTRLTFTHYNKIVKINFGCCVSNFTSGLPSYFGHEWTPDFRIMEAVAASMSIPPAIKPLYIEDDVVKKLPGEPDPPFIRGGEFDLAGYRLYEEVVKTAVGKLIFDDEKTRGTVVNPNNAIDVATFLPKLRDIVVGEYLVDAESKKVTGMGAPQFGINTTVTINGKDYTANYPLYKYFFNAAYKGLFLDGGYRNNIPYNFFRFRNKVLDGVLAIKLDEHFPPHLINEVLNKITAHFREIDVEEFVTHIDIMENLMIPEQESKLIAGVLNQLISFANRTKRAEIFKETEIIFQKYLTRLSEDIEAEPRGKDRRELKRELRKSERAIRRLTRSTIKAFKKSRMSPPWMQPVGILNTAFEGYFYGAEIGQIRQISDHNHILPIYDHGIGTYDFDMSKIDPLIRLAQDVAEQDTLEALE